jgi:hypothetical protein
MQAGRMPPPQPITKTLPLRWVVLAIVIFIVAYTFLRLHYGKHGKPFEPYHDLGERAATQRLVDLGYERVAVDIERPAEILPASRFAPTVDDFGSAPGGLPAELAGALAPKPALPAAITSVNAQQEIASGGIYSLQFICTQPDYKTQLDSVQLIRKGSQLILLPDFPRLSGQLLARWKETVVLVRIPVQGFAPGSYTVTLCGGRESRTWQFTIR